MSSLQKTFWAMLILALIPLVWLATPSSLFIRPTSLSIVGTDVQLVRATPFGPIDAIWRSSIIVVEAGGRQCDGQGRQVVPKVDHDVVSFTIGSWSDDCMEIGPPLVLTYQYQVMLFGLIPLRPTSISTTVNRQTASIAVW